MKTMSITQKAGLKIHNLSHDNRLPGITSFLSTSMPYFTGGRAQITAGIPTNANP